ncbi:50S ribosomal protein L3 [Candidatus Woesearchaeota archaeon]|nr:50S ribosomal protein L3 [Candidatus Woesearchaeota archaeon]
MPKAHRPRHGSMQFWPRVRAKREYKRVQTFSDSKDANLMGFAGYKVGMTHIIITDGRKTSITKGEDVTIPVTIVECPPLRIAGVRFYTKKYKTIQPSGDVMAKVDKALARKITTPNKAPADLDSIKEFDDLRILVQTQPKMVGVGKKKPELFEVTIGGSKEEKLSFAKEHLGKELSVKDVLNEGQFVDIHAVTVGKGTQGPVKRFGVKIRHHKSEKTKRGPGSLGGWKGQAHFMYRVAHAGQMGYHNRIDYNKQIMMIGDDYAKVNAEGGFIRYGTVKNPYVLIKGSIPGPSKRIVRMETALRPDKKADTTPQTVQYISTKSKQGN